VPYRDYFLLCKGATTDLHYFFGNIWGEISDEINQTYPLVNVYRLYLISKAPKDVPYGMCLEVVRQLPSSIREIYLSK